MLACFALSTTASAYIMGSVLSKFTGMLASPDLCFSHYNQCHFHHSHTNTFAKWWNVLLSNEHCFQFLHVLDTSARVWVPTLRSCLIQRLADSEKPEISALSWSVVDGHPYPGFHSIFLRVSGWGFLFSLSSFEFCSTVQTGSAQHIWQLSWSGSWLRWVHGVVQSAFF